MDLKGGVELAVEAVVAELQKKSKKISTSAEVAQVGTISANGEASIGSMIAETMERVGMEGVITVAAAQSTETDLDVCERMQIPRGSLLTYFPTTSPKLVRKQAH